MSQEKDGFFKKFHKQLNDAIDDVTRNNFANIESNSKRVSYINNLPYIKSYDFSQDVIKNSSGGDFPVRKDLEKARQLKNEGNSAVQKGDWVKALQLYSQSLLFMPQHESKYLI